MKRYLSIILFITLSFLLSAESRGSTSLHFQLDAGIGTYIGDFRTHLMESQAWLNSPVLEGAVLIYPGQRWGIGILSGSMAVLHPYSEPIEGIIRYQELLVEYRLGEEPFWLSPFAGVGFQDPGMSLQWYGSGVIDAGIRSGWQFKPDLALTATLGFRTSFFRSMIIPKEYNISYWDNLSSLRLSFGLRYRI